MGDSVAFPHATVVIELSDEFTVTPEARRFLVKSSRPERPPVPMAVIGTGVLVRAVLTLLVNAIRITMRMDVPLSFFSTEPLARAWLTEQLVHRSMLIAKNTGRS